MKQKPCNRWSCTHTHTHTHTDNFLLKEKNNNLIEYKGRITKNLCYAVFDFVQKQGLCKA